MLVNKILSVKDTVLVCVTKWRHNYKALLADWRLWREWWAGWATLNLEYSYSKESLSRPYGYTPYSFAFRASRIGLMYLWKDGCTYSRNIHIQGDVQQRKRIHSLGVASELRVSMLLLTGRTIELHDWVHTTYTHQLLLRLQHW